MNGGEPAVARDQLLAAANACLALAPHAAERHYLLGRYLQTDGEWGAAVTPLELAIGKNPSFALAHATLAQSLHVAGRSDESLVRMRHAERLGPRSFATTLAGLHFMRAEYTEALVAAERAVVINPRHPYAHALAAACCWWLGDVHRGRVHLATLRERHPLFRPDLFAATFGAKVDVIERFTRALAGLSDT